MFCYIYIQREREMCVCIYIYTHTHIIQLFIYFRLCWVFITATLFSSCSKQGLLSSQGAQASDCDGFSCFGAQALGHLGFSSCGFQALEHRLSSCGVGAQLFCGMWDLLGPGIEPISPTLAGGFFTTEPAELPEIMIT